MTKESCLKKGLVMALVMGAVLSLAGCPKEAGSSGGGGENGGTPETLSLESIQGTWVASVPSDQAKYYQKITISDDKLKFESEYITWEADIKTVYPKNAGEGYITIKWTNSQASTQFSLNYNSDGYEPYYSVLLFGKLTNNSFKLGVSYQSNRYKWQEFTLEDDSYEAWIDDVKNGNIIYNRQ